MRPSVQVHDALARLVEYPREGFDGCVEEAADCVGKASAEAGEQLSTFIEWARCRPLGELEESFTRTFDNTEERALEVGWHAFGESYTRGTFMVKVRGWLREHGIEESGELPDHLTHVLRLLGRCDPDQAVPLATDTVGPAMEKVHDALLRGENPWAGVIGAVRAVLALHGGTPGHAAASPSGEETRHE